MIEWEGYGKRKETSLLYYTVQYCYYACVCTTYYDYTVAIATTTPVLK